MHDSCSFCSGYVCDGIHGDGICNRYKEERSRRPQSGQPSSVVTCQVCRGTLAEGESHDAPCGNAAHCTKDGKSHGAAPCGTGGHFACDGKTHEKAACGDHYACDSKKHDKAACGHYVCDGASHGNAACGDHYTCAEGYSAEDHADCSCGAPYCDGHVHVSTSKPRCPSCNEKVSAKNAHLADCQTHYFCETNFGEAGNHNAKGHCGVHLICLGTDDCNNKCACGASYV